MEIQETYSVPFESFEWRTTLFEIINGLARESAISVIKKYKEDSQELEWKDNEMILDFAFQQDMFKKVYDEMIKRAEKMMEP